MAVDIPVGLVLLGLAAGESLQAIIVLGIFGLIVALMLRKSVPRVPFG